ncbi:RNA polymerase sigma-70 factor, ECF subfamily [Paracoccus alcaliphilus]|uniref:RNA polymerase sigma-70 factor, ECF subfamily n=1 Tax=Paracoccus alcaliphilus TaxID=34002 RepID=A0A1H8EKW6_9RHOB|nr:RNA polymerase sigma factor SigJ [Paracoccus alcaliphilus]WCR20850.1 RNA polymerase sigma factor SigJ [Paracoccus alcaliphilus]SEN19507.1 RNA polymerase sigma-70 factor, ECF subfamily [Paracoccus alcaliphilus]
MTAEQQIKTFGSERRRLAGLAYRMTGSVADTEDILQEAWLRFSRQDLAAIDQPSRWLGAVVTRLCLDHLKSARMRRETYVGAWLPEPLVQSNDPGAEQSWIVTEDVGIALILTLDRLSPEMRAAFILRDAFDYGFDEIAAVVGRTPATCRQLVSRARRRLAGADVASSVSPADALPIVTAFWQASREGDMAGLLRLFAEEIEVHTDGGGKVPASINVLRGRRRAVGFFAGVARKWPHPPDHGPHLCRINGSPGFVSVELGGIIQTTALAIRGGRIAAIWIVRNPEKLRHIPPEMRAGPHAPSFDF